MIEAATVHPHYGARQRITADDLRRVSEPCVIFEHAWLDSDNAKCWAYTVGGWLDGKPLGGLQGGVTIGGDVLIVHADSRTEADAVAALILRDTIDSLDNEEDAFIEAHAALARLSSVGAKERMDMASATPANTSDAFVADTQAIRKLRGDDILLTTGGASS
jgi:hypothetical protein